MRINGQELTPKPEWRAASLLAILRDELGLVGAKFGCGVGSCGACTVIVDGTAQRSCVLPSEAVAESSVETIESLAAGGTLHPVQQAWLDTHTPQCGYCQAGQIMTAVALLRERPRPTDAEIDAAFIGNLCRCGTYDRIRRAVKLAAGIGR